MMSNVRKRSYSSLIAAYCCIILIGLSAHHAAWASSSEVVGRCQIIFSLRGDSQAVFEDQTRHLAHHIKRLNIELIDLNNRRNATPYTDLSGRQRRQLKHDLLLADDQSRAFVRLNQSTIFQTSGSIDLTLLIQTCQKRQNF